MTTDPQIEFACSIYCEHLEEAAFLYEQRRFLLDDPELGWLALESFEQRLDAHLEGLTLGAGPSLEVCRQALEGGGDGTCYAAVRVFCRLDEFESVRFVLEKTEPSDCGKVQALADALAAEMPDSDARQWLEKLSPEMGRLVPVAIRLAGLGRLNATASLVKLLHPDPLSDLPLLIWAVSRARGREPDKGFIPQTLFSFLDHDDRSIRSTAALSLLRMGSDKALSVCRENALRDSWSHQALGLSGGRPDAKLLMQAALSTPAAGDALTGLGLLGSIKAVELLIDFLGQPRLAGRAAAALSMITGAALQEQVFVADRIDRDELFDDELEKLQKGQPLHVSEHEPGAAVARISQDKKIWRGWWLQNKMRFDTHLRYRHGKPFSVECLLETLQSPQSSRRLRRYALDELAIRYSVDMGFETDMFVSRQRRAIDHWLGRMRAGEKQFEPGGWYFSGVLLYTQV